MQGVGRVHRGLARTSLPAWLGLRHFAPLTASGGPRVLLVGLHPNVVDFSKYPGLTPTKLEAGYEADRNFLVTQGINADWCLVDRGETAIHVLELKLQNEKRAVECVMVGVGIRMPPYNTHLFERIINTLRAQPPTRKAKFCFNTNPFDTAEAVLRWVERPKT